MVCARSSSDLVLEVVVSESVFGILVVKERKDEWRRKRFCESVQVDTPKMRQHPK